MTNLKSDLEPHDRANDQCRTCSGMTNAPHALRDCVVSLSARLAGVRMGLEATQNRQQAMVHHYG